MNIRYLQDLVLIADNTFITFFYQSPPGLIRTINVEKRVFFGWKRKEIKREIQLKL